MPRKHPEHQLDLFDDLSEQHPPIVRTAHAPACPPSPWPTWHIPRPETLPAHASWREITLGEHTLGYVLRRSRRKTIGLMVHDDGLQIQAPTWSTLAHIEQAIREKSSWILRKLQARAQHLRLLALQDNPWRSGGRIPYLGVQISLQLDGTQAAHYQGQDNAPETSDVLCLPLPGDALADRIRESACTWLQQRAVIDFSRRLDHYLARADQTIQGWRLSSASARWGSCSSARRIMLNWRLIHFAPTIIDYVVAHEVAHLRIMNHSPAFWRELEGLYPDYKHARDTLRQHQPTTLPLI
ncbi:M48 family metallopeptidase [Alcaligenaceae bacterium CGII-47]|nr:M48 family metallopeptidase [Alcaligenaceae bacterium CGII-47]